MSELTNRVTLPRFTLGAWLLGAAAVAASSPLTVTVGALPVMFGVLGVVGTPLAYVLVMGVMRLLVVGYVSVGRHVKHSAPFYAQLARGLGPTAGLVGAGLAFVGYNALQISLYGLIGFKAVSQFHGGFWWAWAFVAWLLVMAFGQLRGQVVTRVLLALLLLEILVLGLLIVAAVTHPADGGVSVDGFGPAQLVVKSAVAGVLVFAVASYAGVELALALAEEATSPDAVRWAVGRAVVFCGVLYALVAWAYLTWIGPEHLSRANQDGYQPLALLGGIYGPAIGFLSNVLLLTSVLAAQVSFHSTVARYVYALAREFVLPQRLASFSRGPKGGAPLGGSAVQSVTAVIVVAGFLVGGADPLTMFTWLSALGAFCVLLLLTLASGSAWFFFDKGRYSGTEPPWRRQYAPFLGGGVGLVVLLVMGWSLGTLLATPPGSALPWLIAVPIVLVVVAGLAAGRWLRRHRREVYDGISFGVPDPILARDDRYGAVTL